MFSKTNRKNHAHTSGNNHAQRTIRETSRDEVSSMMQAFEIVHNVPDLVKAMVQEQIIRIRLDTWPKSFAAVLIAAGVQCDESRREAVRRYVELLDDCERHRTQLSQPPQQLGPAERDSMARWERQLKYARSTLDHLGVTIADVPLRSAFDAEVHTTDPDSHPANGTVETVYRDEHHSIAAVHSPLFTWKDSSGNRQCVSADVSVYVFTQ